MHKPDLDLHKHIIKVHNTSTYANTGPERKQARFKTGGNLALIKYYEWPKNWFFQLQLLLAFCYRFVVRKSMRGLSECFIILSQCLKCEDSVHPWYATEMGQEAGNGSKILHDSDSLPPPHHTQNTHVFIRSFKKQTP